MTAILPPTIAIILLSLAVVGAIFRWSAEAIDRLGGTSDMDLAQIGRGLGVLLALATVAAFIGAFLR